MVALLGPFEVIPGVGPARMVRVHVPKRAASSDRPALVLFDGQNVFDDAPSFAGGWRAHELVDRLTRRSNPPVVIGIDHGHSHRLSELSPFPVEGQAPGIEPFLQWVADWLMPRLREGFGLSRDRRKVVVGGSSMGGLAALYALLRRPDVFGGALAMSPSIWVAGRAMNRVLREVSFEPGSRVYLDAGRHEASGRLLDATVELARTIESHPHVDLRFVADPRGHHREASWRRRLPAAVRFHFDLESGRSPGKHTELRAKPSRRSLGLTHRSR
jgi:enterochelin esterase-like enzyme